MSPFQFQNVLLPGIQKSRPKDNEILSRKHFFTIVIVGFTVTMQTNERHWAIVIGGHR